MRDAKLAAWIVGASLAYAVLRYNVFRGDSWEQLPVFIVNKAISVGSLGMLGASRVVADKARRKRLGLAAFMLAALHVLLSLMVMNPSYIDKMYLPSGRMSWSAELSMLTGAVATSLLMWLAYSTTLRPLDSQQHATSLVPGMARGTLVLVAAHVLYMGYGAWFTPASWPGAMPPITLLSFALALGFFVLPRRPTRP
ncbi:MAG: hypothetical protein U0168_18060 [Nannocystaceae bacterium]